MAAALNDSPTYLTTAAASKITGLLTAGVAAKKTACLLLLHSRWSHEMDSNMQQTMEQARGVPQGTSLRDSCTCLHCAPHWPQAL